MCATTTDRSRGDNSNNASHVLAGFRYQLLHSVAALVALANNETLCLEVSEDFSITGPGQTTDHQVKNSQAIAGAPAYSLQSKLVQDCLSRFWDKSDEPETVHRLVFMARGGVAVERRFEFPNKQAGLFYWQAAAIDADTGPLRKALSEIFSGQPLAEWLSSNPDDSELRAKLLRRVNWQLELLPADDLAKQITDQLRPAFYERGWPITLAEPAMKLLVHLVFETAAKPDATDRQLTHLDFRQVLESAASGAWLANQFAQPAPSSPPTQEILVSELDHTSAGAFRTNTVDRLLQKVQGQPLVWLHGAHGVGKSTLAKLLARRLGGRWLVLDLRPVYDDETSALAAWRELMRLSSGRQLDGIIIDDFVSEAGRRLRSRLSALVRLVAPLGTRTIVTSHYPASTAFLTEAGVGESASVQAPYFDDEDIGELVPRHPAPPDEMIPAWVAMLYFITGGGHPTLVTAKLAGLRARNWPSEALIEDFETGIDPSIQLTREEARRDLLSGLRELDETRSLETGELLRRAASVFDRSNYELLLKLAAAEPPIRNATDAISILKGAWLELLPYDDVRVSPLISDIYKDVSPEEQKRWRRIAAEHWLEKRTLDERTLPLCFWNAFLGEHDGVLMKLCETLHTMDHDKSRAAAPILVPVAFFNTDAAIYNNHPLLNLYLRYLQFEIADAVDKPDIAGNVAERFMLEADDIGETGLLLLSAAGPRFVMSLSANIRPKLRVQYVLKIRSAIRLIETLFAGLIPDPRKLLPPESSDDMDYSDFLFVTAVPHISGSADQLELVEALDNLDSTTRNQFIRAVNAMYSGPSVFISAGWSHDHIEGRDMNAALHVYEKMRGIVGHWDKPDLMAEIDCSRSIILDEGLEEKDRALAVVETALQEFGGTPSLVRQKSKVLASLGRHDEATSLLMTIEDCIGADSSFERALALREGGISAAKSDRFLDAIRLFSKAHESFSASMDSAQLAAGLLVELSLALWRNDQKSEAILIAADALDAVEQIDPTASRQAERSHQFARALVGLMSMEPSSSNGKQTPPFTFGQASQIEGMSSKLLGVDLKALPDNWRILAAVEADIGYDIGINLRSMEKQGESLHLDVETLIMAYRYSNAMKSRETGKALRLGTILLAARNLNTVTSPGDDSGNRIARDELEALDPAKLIEDRNLTEGIQSLILDTLTVHVLAENLDVSMLSRLRDQARSIFGLADSIESIFDAASQLYAIGIEAPRAIFFASRIAICPENVDADPSRRFERDIVLIVHAMFSLARTEVSTDVAKTITSGWTQVLNTQRFLLREPSNVASSIELAISNSSAPTLASAASVLLAARYSVAHNFGDGWFEALAKEVDKAST